MSEILDAIKQVQSRFQNNDLAYVALTGKPELQVRDEIAKILRANPSPGVLIGREWSQSGKPPCDLSFVHDGIPLSIIELKAMYTFETIIKGKSPTHFPKALVED